MSILLFTLAWAGGQEQDAETLYQLAASDRPAFARSLASGAGEELGRIYERMRRELLSQH